MINLDTNILLRAFKMDDAVQSPQAKALLESFTPEKPGFISTAALAELAGVLKRYYKESRETIAGLLRRILESAELRIEHESLVEEAVRLYGTSNVEFGDCLIQASGVKAGCEYTVTFDEAAAKTIGMRLLTQT